MGGIDRRAAAGGRRSSALLALTLAFAAAFITFKVRESMRDNDVSVTGTIAGLLVFALGVYAMWGDLRIAAAVGVALVGLLAFKDALHDWLDKVTWKELRSALLILARDVHRAAAAAGSHHRSLGRDQSARAVAAHHPRRGRIVRRLRRGARARRATSACLRARRRARWFPPPW